MAEAENILSPEELDALSSGIEDGSIEAGAGLNISARAVKHDIVKKDSSKGVNVDVINTVNTRFLSKFKNELSTVFRTEVKGAAREVKLMPYHEYCEMATAPSASNVIKLKPLHGNSYKDLSRFQLTFTIKNPQNPTVASGMDSCACCAVNPHLI